MKLVIGLDILVDNEEMLVQIRKVNYGHLEYMIDENIDTDIYAL
jgi:hypothetical protein